MPKFFRRSSTKSYDLLSGFSFYVPGIGGTLVLLAMLLAGACLGNLVTALLMFFTDIGTANDYGMLLSYPVMFLPVLSGDVPSAHVVCFIPEQEESVLRSRICAGQQSFREAERLGGGSYGRRSDPCREHDNRPGSICAASDA